MYALFLGKSSSGLYLAFSACSVLFILSLSDSSSHRECIRELGEPVMKKAYQLLDKVDPEQAEV